MNIYWGININILENLKVKVLIEWNIEFERVLVLFRGLLVIFNNNENVIEVKEVIFYGGLFIDNVDYIRILLFYS